MHDTWRSVCCSAPLSRASICLIFRCKVWKYTSLPDYTRVDCGRPRIYPGVDPALYSRVDYSGYQSLPLPPGSTPLSRDYVKCLRLSESTVPPRIYPPFQQLYATLPESTPSSQNIPPFSTTICDPPRIYPALLV